MNVITISLTVEEPEFQWDDDELTSQKTGTDEQGDPLL